MNSNKIPKAKKLIKKAIPVIIFVIITIGFMMFLWWYDVSVSNRTNSTNLGGGQRIEDVLGGGNNLPPLFPPVLPPVAPTAPDNSIDSSEPCPICLRGDDCIFCLPQPMPSDLIDGEHYRLTISTQQHYSILFDIYLRQAEFESYLYGTYTRLTFNLRAISHNLMQADFLYDNTQFSATITVHHERVEIFGNEFLELVGFDTSLGNSMNLLVDRNI